MMFAVGQRSESALPSGECVCTCECVSVSACASGQAPNVQIMIETNCGSAKRDSMHVCVRSGAHSCERIVRMHVRSDKCMRSSVRRGVCVWIVKARPVGISP
jgi:hypothetical protein